MNKFKSKMLTSHTRPKDNLRELYVDRHVHVSSLSSSEQPIADESIFYYDKLSFRFHGTGFRTMERMVLMVGIPEELLFDEHNISNSSLTAYEDYLLRITAEPVNELSKSYINDHKSGREKPQFSMQTVNSVVQRRNGCRYHKESKEFWLRILFTVPLINGININGKSAYKAVREVIQIIAEKIAQIDKVELREHICLYAEQLELRAYLKEHGLVAFVKNGSILPRNGATQEPMQGAVPFVSPKELEVQITMKNGTIVSGMGIKKGITIITGGGYSGKSTLLDSLEMGIYNHVRGDGREYVITEDSACKIYAEDGRYIKDTDISPFFEYMPNQQNVHQFSTQRASGSVSQAASIIEAVYAQCQLLMIDEDTSATNFMIRDAKMRELVKKEPIIPFTDRVEELREKGISTILVIGGSSEYLSYADTLILMEDYIAQDKTEYVKTYIQNNIKTAKNQEVNRVCDWTQKRYLLSECKKGEFFYTQCVQIENARYIKIDNYVADITKLTALISKDQINSLTYLLTCLLGEDNEEKDLLERCQALVNRFFVITDGIILAHSHKYELWLSEVRPLELLMAMSRLRREKN